MCPIRRQIDTLDEDNARAWRWFHTVCTRLTIDAGMAGAALQAISQDLDGEEVEDVLQRLATIYDILYPPKRQESR